MITFAKTFAKSLNIVMKKLSLDKILPISSLRIYILPKHLQLHVAG